MSTMPVFSLECELTQVQLKRYLAGETLPQDLMEGMERHLRACDDCMAVAEEQRRAMGGGDVNPSKAGLFQRLSVLRPRVKPAEALVSAPGTDPLKPTGLAALSGARNLALSASLATVLVLMSTVFKQPTGFLGPKASEPAAKAKSTHEEPKEEEANLEPKADKGHKQPEHPDTPADKKAETHKEAQPKDEHSEKEIVLPHGLELKKNEKQPAPKPKSSTLIVAESGKPIEPHVEKPKPPAPKKPATTKHRAPVHKPTTRRTRPVRKPVVRTKTTKPAPANSNSAHGSVRVYDQNGKPKK